MDDEEFKRSIEGVLVQAARLGREPSGIASREMPPDPWAVVQARRQEAARSAADEAACASVRHVEMERHEALLAADRRERSAYVQAAKAQAQRAAGEAGAAEVRPMVRGGSGFATRVRLPVPMAGAGLRPRPRLAWAAAALVLAMGLALAAYLAWPGVAPAGSSARYEPIAAAAPAAVPVLASLPVAMTPLEAGTTAMATGPALAPTPAPTGLPTPAPGWPTLGVVAEAEDGAPSSLASSLGRSIVSAGRLNVASVATDGWAASLAALQVQPQPRVLVARYDLLQAVRRVPDAAPHPSLQVVAPLATEPIYFVARADSKLRYIHQIQFATINIGPQGSARALTAASVYRDMFGSAMPTSRLDRLDERAAIERLIDDRSVDVVILVGGSPQWWAERAGGAGRDGKKRLKLLELDPMQPESRRAARNFLPLTIDAGALGELPSVATSTLSVMSFIVTAAGAVSDEHSHEEAITALARGLCNPSTSLQPERGSAWRAVRPDMQLDVGWPWSAAARDVFASCGALSGSANHATGS
ncbi:MAG: TRAP-type uncharacterized transport system protein periplasmic component [Rhizobacter sp.]|nr:TRAP-type uncharacterized transport system protein periplasmic component [Rhizobacter sp.]